MRSSLSIQLGNNGVYRVCENPGPNNYMPSVAEQNSSEFRLQYYNFIEEKGKYCSASTEPSRLLVYHYYHHYCYLIFSVRFSDNRRNTIIANYITLIKPTLTVNIITYSLRVFSEYSRQILFK